MDNENTNGNIPVRQYDSIGDDYRDKRSRQQAYLVESESLRRQWQDKLAALQTEREQAMLRASDHAGNIGLVYRAEINWFSRVIISDEMPQLPQLPEFSLSGELAKRFGTEAPDPEDAGAASEDAANDGDQTDEGAIEKPESAKGLVDRLSRLVPKPRAVPAPPQRPQLPKAPVPRANDSKWHRASFWKSLVSWLLSSLVGLFVGFGLLKITQINYEDPEMQFAKWLMFALGMAAILSMKLFLDVAWYEVGRRKALGALDWQFRSLMTLLSSVVIGVEAALGGQAMIQFTRSISLRGGMHPLVAMGLAVAVTTATLLFSATLGFQKGQRGVTQEDVETNVFRHELEQHRKTIEEMEKLYDEEVARWRESTRMEREVSEKVQSIKLEALELLRDTQQQVVERWKGEVAARVDLHNEGRENHEQRIAEYQAFRNLPDFQALCKYISVIEALNVRIAEMKKLMDNESISRGHQQKNVI